MLKTYNHKPLCARCKKCNKQFCLEISKQVHKKANLNKFNICEIKEICSDDGKILAYVTELEPEGFIITSADDKIRPIIGYSFQGKFPFEDSKQNVLLHLVQWDMEARSKALNSKRSEIMSLAQSNTNSWETYTSDSSKSVQIAASSSTLWDSLITTQWYQGGHYEEKCPLETIGGTSRCAVGCVAISTAQILNYWKYPSSLSFNNSWWPIVYVFSNNETNLPLN